MGTYSGALFSQFGNINENSAEFYLFTGSSSWGWWIRGFELYYRVVFCFALECSLTFLVRQHLNFTTLGCVLTFIYLFCRLFCFLTGDYFCLKTFFFFFWLHFGRVRFYMEDWLYHVLIEKSLSSFEKMRNIPLCSAISQLPVFYRTGCWWVCFATRNPDFSSLSLFCFSEL